MRAYTNFGLTHYIKSRFSSGHPVRLAIIPFDVPENFARPARSSLHYGQELARMFQLELKRTGEVPIVEIFNRESWPGKREDFASGNYGAISIARDAGYDLVVVGQLADIKNESTLELFTKIIDVDNAVTIWDSRTLWISHDRELRRAKAYYGFAQDRPELFDFPGRSQDLVMCVVEKILTEEVVPNYDTRPRKEQKQEEGNLDPATS